MLFRSINSQPHYQHGLAAVSEPVNLLKSTCQQLYQHLSAALLAPVSLFIGTCQPLYHQLSGAGAAPISSLIINCQPHYQHLLAAVSEPVNLLLCWPWEAQTSICPAAAPGKSGLHACGEGERVLALESREGTRPGHRKMRPLPATADKAADTC